jgi:Polyketide cyclase / dehydrase and lipid transport
MKPITVSVVVDRPREEVFAHLDVLANHEAFTDHFLQDWTLSGPAAGVGAKARFRSRNDWMDLEVLESQAPVRTVERTVGAGGKRLTRGTYTLTEEPGGRTRVEFELVYEQGPASERMAAPLIRAVLRRANERAMERLREVLEPAAARAA